MIKTTIKSAALIFVLGMTMGACSDFLEQQPPPDGDNVLPDDAVRTAQDLQEVLISAYDVLANTYNGSIQTLPELLTDNLNRPFNQDNFSEVWLRSTTIFNGSVGGAFSNAYIAILRANTVLLRADDVEIEPGERLRIEAESRFIRALCHFDIVRLFAQPYGSTPDNSHPGIAIRTTTDIENLPRNTVAEVYNFILADLEFAKQNLPPNVGVFASQSAALALEAAVRFQMQEYDLAYALADEAINSGQTSFDEVNVSRYTFPEVSDEAFFYIFSYTFAEGNVDSRNGAFRGNYLSEGANITLRMSEDFYNGVTASGAGSPRASLFETRDLEGNVINVTNIFNPEFFHIPILSHTQMLLIRAESAGELNQNIPQAIDDINRIRVRAYGGVINNLTGSATAQDVINAARIESRYEMAFTGQRFHDLKRRGAQGENIVVRGAPWDCNGMVLQFPSTEETELFPLNPAGGC